MADLLPGVYDRNGAQSVEEDAALARPQAAGFGEDAYADLDGKAAALRPRPG